MTIKVVRWWVPQRQSRTAEEEEEAWSVEGELSESAVGDIAEEEEGASSVEGELSESAVGGGAVGGRMVEARAVTPWRMSG